MSEPPAKFWPATTFPYRQKIGRLWKGSSRNVRRKLGLPEQDQMDQIFINEEIWGTLKDACMWASAQIDNDLAANLRVLRGAYFSDIKPMFSITKNRIHSLDTEEVIGF